MGFYFTYYLFLDFFSTVHHHEMKILATFYFSELASLVNLVKMKLKVKFLYLE